MADLIDSQRTAVHGRAAQDHSGSHTLLVVEDDTSTLEFLADNLRADRYKVLEATSVKDALSLLERKPCDLVLLDLVLPDEVGFELCDRIRSADGLNSRIDAQTPIIVLTGRSAQTDRVRGFERGVDDYLTKPFHYGELRARIEAVLRRSSGRCGKGALRVGSLLVDPTTRTVKVADRKVDLSAKEFSLLQKLASEPHRVWSKQELLKLVWGYESFGRTRTVDSHASRLRRKLGGGTGNYVVNVWGIGYRLIDEAVL